MPQPNDFQTILPLTILTVWACALLLADLFIPKGKKWITAFLTAAGLAVTLGFTLAQIGSNLSAVCLASRWPLATSNAWASNAANTTPSCFSASSA